MFENIKRNLNLNDFIVDKCCENDICLNFDDGIPEDDKIIIKIDDYYNSLNLGNNTPPSPDCLILVRCNNGGGVSLHIAELKNITTSARYNISNLLGKFNTCIDNFILERFPELFNVEYKTVKLYFISKIDIHTRDMGLNYEILTNYRKKFNGHTLMIKAFMPTPKIKQCY